MLGRALIDVRRILRDEEEEREEEGEKMRMGMKNKMEMGKRMDDGREEREGGGFCGLRGFDGFKKKREEKRDGRARIEARGRT